MAQFVLRIDMYGPNPVVVVPSDILEKLFQADTVQRYIATVNLIKTGREV